MPKSKAKPERVADREILTSELAQIIGKTPQWVRQLTRDGVLTQQSRGKYLLSEAVQAYIEHVSGGKEDDAKPRLVDYKTEHERIKAEKAALELAEMQGNLHSSEDVQVVMSDMIVTAKSKMLAIPSRVSLQLDGEPSTVIEKVLTKEISTALASLTDYNPTKFREKAGEHDGDPEEDA